MNEQGSLRSALSWLKDRPYGCTDTRAMKSQGCGGDEHLLTALKNKGYVEYFGPHGYWTKTTRQGLAFLDGSLPGNSASGVDPAKVAAEGIGSTGPMQGHPKVFISYSHEGEERGGAWMEVVNTFARLLRVNYGLDVELDQFDENYDRLDWSSYGPKQVALAEVVLCLASPEYKKAWNGDVQCENGASVEARATRAKFGQGGRGRFVVLPCRSVDDIPSEQRSIDYTIVRSIEEKDEGIEGLVRRYTNQPSNPRPSLGSIPTLPPRR